MCGLAQEDEIFKTVIPSKMLEFMSCARAVILGVEGQASKILEEAQAGICIEPGNSRELAQAVLRLADDGPLRETLAATVAAMFYIIFRAAKPR